MFKIISIGDNNVPVLAKASTNVYYKSIFHEDPITVQSQENVDNAERVYFSQKLTFVMVKQAEAQAAVSAGTAPSVRDYMQKLTEDDYLDWLDECDFMDLQESFDEVIAVYTASNKTTSKAKK